MINVTPVKTWFEFLAPKNGHLTTLPSNYRGFFHLIIFHQPKDLLKIAVPYSGAISPGLGVWSTNPKCPGDTREVPDINYHNIINYHHKLLPGDIGIGTLQHTERHLWVNSLHKLPAFQSQNSFRRQTKSRRSWWKPQRRRRTKFPRASAAPVATGSNIFFGISLNLECSYLGFPYLLSSQPVIESQHFKDQGSETLFPWAWHVLLTKHPDVLTVLFWKHVKPSFTGLQCITISHKTISLLCHPFVSVCHTHIT